MKLVALGVGIVVLVVAIGVGGWYGYAYYSLQQLKSEARAHVAAERWARALPVLDQISEKLGAGNETEDLLELYSKSHIGMENYPAARRYANRLTSQFRANVTGHNMAGEVNFHTGQYEDALQSFQQARQINPTNPAALAGIGKCAYKLGEAQPDQRAEWWSKAETNLRQAIDGNPSYIPGYLWLGELMLERGKSDPAQLPQAESLATSALKHAPDNAHAYRLLGHVRLLQGQLESAEEALTRALNIRRKDAAIHHVLGMVYFLQRNLVKAREHLNSAVKQAPGSIQYLMDYAACLAMQEEWGASKEALMSAVVKAPERMLPRLRLALASFHDKDEARALSSLKEAVVQAKPSAALAYELASLAYQVGEQNLAEEYYARAAQLDPQNPYALYNIGTINLLLANFSEAERQLEKAARFADSDPNLKIDAKLNLGLVYFNSDQAQKATEQFADVLELAPDSVWAHINYGIGLARQKNIREAITHFQRAIELDPDAFEAHLNLGLLYSEQQRFTEAEQILQRALQLAPTDDARDRVHMSLGLVYYRSNALDEAEAELSTVLVSQSEQTLQRANNALACVALKRGDLARAQQLLQDLLDRPQTTSRGRVLVNEAILQARKGNPAAALQSLEEALQHEDAMALAFFNRAVIRVKHKEELQQAAQDLQRAYREDPQLAEAHYNLALLYERLGRDDRAAQEYRKALGVNEFYGDALINLALLRVREGANIDDLLQRALEAQPDDPRVALVRGYRSLLAEDYDQAVVAAQEALSRNAELQQAYALLGYALVRQQQYDQARTALEQAVELNAEDAISQLNYAALLHREGRLVEAEQHMLQAREIRPRLPEVYRALVSLYLDMSLYVEALDAIRMANELSPATDMLAGVRQEIEALMNGEPGAS